MATATRRKLTKGYRALIEELPLAPIKSQAQLKSARRMLDRLLARKLDRGEADYFEVLSGLVESYESRHVKIPDPTLAELLNFLMESRGVSAVDVARNTGIAESTISQMRSGKRACSKVNCRRLAECFHVAPASFFEATVGGAC